MAASPVVIRCDERRDATDGRPPSVVAMSSGLKPVWARIVTTSVAWKRTTAKRPSWSRLAQSLERLPASPIRCARAVVSHAVPVRAVCRVNV
jgi:hypothetical protein